MKIQDIIEKYISGDWGEGEITSTNTNPVYCVRGADIEPIKRTDYDNIPLRYITSASFNNKRLQTGDIVVEKSGGSPTQSTGRVCLITPELIEQKRDIVCTNFCVAFRVKPEWDAEYVYLYMQYIYNAGVFFNFEGKTSGLRNLQLEQAFGAIDIPQISIAEQKKIASVIRTIDKKIAFNRAINRNLPQLDHLIGAGAVRRAAA